MGIGVYGVVIAGGALGAFVLALRHLRLSKEQAGTISFLTLAMAQLWHEVNMRARGTNLVRNAIVNNPFVWDVETAERRRPR